MADDVLQHLADVRRADEHRRRAGEALAPHAASSGVAAHRVLELGPVRLDRERAPPRAAPTGPPSRTWFAKTRSAGKQLA